MFGEGIAVLAGDLLLNRAYERLFTLCLDRPGVHICKDVMM